MKQYHEWIRRTHMWIFRDQYRRVIGQMKGTLDEADKQGISMKADSWTTKENHEEQINAGIHKTPIQSTRRKD